MGLIPQQRSRQPAPTGRSRALQPLGGDPIAAGLRRVGRGVSQAERQRDSSAVIEATANMRAEFAGRYSTAIQEAKPDGTGFQEGLLSQLDNYVAGVSASLPSDDARKLFSDRVNTFRGQLEERAEAFEVQAAGDHRALQLGRAIDATANAVRSDGGQYDDARAEILASLEAAEQDLPADRIAVLRDGAEQALAQAALLSAIDEDPTAALAALNSGDFDARLTPSQKNALLNRATAERDRLAREAEARARLDRAEYAAGFQDYLAFLEAGNAPDGRYADDDLVANLGERAAAEAIEQRKRSEDFGADLASIATASPEEEAAILAARRADMETPEDFRAEASEFGRLVDAIGEKRRQIGADAAGYVQRHVPEVADAYRSMIEAQAAVAGSQDPESALAASAAAAQRYVRLVESEQLALGVPPAETRILPAGAAGGMVQQFRASRGEAAAGVLIAQAERFGAAWPRVAAELRDAGLPDVGVVIGSMTRRSQAWAAGRIAELAAADTSLPDLRKVIGEDSAGQIDDAVFDELRGFRESLATVSGGVEIYNAIAEQTARLAYDLSRGGDSGAAATAAAVVVNDHYAFDQFRGRTLRVPVERDRAAVMAGAGVFAGAPAGLGPFTVPPSLDAALDDGQVAELYRQALSDGAYWVTNGDESGLVMMDPLGGVVLRADGTAVSVGWTELERAGRNAIEIRRSLEEASP